MRLTDILAPAAPAAPKRQFFDDIAGLRGIAVLVVVAFHSRIPFIPNHSAPSRRSVDSTMPKKRRIHVALSSGADPSAFATGEDLGDECAPGVSWGRSTCRARSRRACRKQGCAAECCQAQGVAYIAILSTVVGYGLWGALMARYPASTVAPATLLVPGAPPGGGAPGDVA